MEGRGIGHRMGHTEDFKNGTIRFSHNWHPVLKQEILTSSFIPSLRWIPPGNKCRYSYKPKGFLHNRPKNKLCINKIRKDGIGPCFSLFSQQYLCSVLNANLMLVRKCSLYIAG